MTKINSFFIFKKSFSLYILIIIFSLIEKVISMNKEDKLINRKLLASSNNLSLAYNRGLLSYNNNFLNPKMQYRNKENDDINFLVSDFDIENTEYYFNIRNNFLYIYNSKNKNVYFHKLYIEQNVKPIIMLKNNSILYLYLIKGNLIILNQISLHLNHNFQEIKKSNLYKFNESSLINCQMNNKKNIIQCLCYQNNDFIIYELYLENYNQLKKEIKKKLNFPYKTKSIMKIEFVISNDNIFFVCFLYNDYSSICFIINHLLNNSNLIPCSPHSNCKNIKLFYSQEQNEFIIVCQKKNKFLLSIIKNNIFEIKRNINICKHKTYLHYNRDSFFSFISNKLIKDFSFLENFNIIQTKNLRSLSEKIKIFNSKDINNRRRMPEEDATATDYLFESDESEELTGSNTYISQSYETTNIIGSTNEITEEITNEKAETTIAEENIEGLINTLLYPQNEEFIETLDKIIQDKTIEMGNPYKFERDNFILIIKSINSSDYKEFSNIDFSECEKVLRQKNKINDSSELTLLQLEIKNEHNQSLINPVKYRIYDENKKHIDISECKDTDIIIHHPLDANILSLLDLQTIKDLKNSGINVFDINDPFFNDLCYPFTFQDMDIVLEDRRYLFYQNYSFCEEGCININIDLEKNFSSCQCKVKEIITNQIMENSFQKENNIEVSNSNIDVVKCTDLIFDFSNKSKNIGFIIFCILISFYLILIITHFVKGIINVSDFVHKEMIKYNYLKEEDRKFFEKGKIMKKINFKQVKKPNNINRVNKSLLARSNQKNIKKKKKGIINKDNKININISNNSSKRIIKSTNLLFENNRRKGDSDSELNSNPPIKKRIIKKNKEKKPMKGIKGMKEKKQIKGILKNTNKKKFSEEVDNLGIIKIDLNRPRERMQTKESSKTLHNFSFDNPNRYEGRSIFTITYIFLLSKQILFHTFLEKSPLVPFQINYCIFIFMICFDLSISALFYSNNNISEKSKSDKSLLSFTFSSNTVIIIISCFASLIVLPIIIKFSKVDSSIRNIFAEEEKKIRKNKNYKIDYSAKMKIFAKVENALKYYKIKLGFFLFFVLVLILGFCYFITAFCQVYPNTQTSLLINCLISILIRFVVELLLCLLFAKLYLVAAKVEYVCFFKFMLFVYDFSC